MANISHKCFLPHVIKRHAGESFRRTGDMFWKFWHPTLLLDHQVEHLHELLPELLWVAPGPKQRVTWPGYGKPQSSSFGTASHESSMIRIKYHEVLKYKPPNIQHDCWRFQIPFAMKCWLHIIAERNRKKIIELDIICTDSMLYASKK